MIVGCYSVDLYCDKRGETYAEEQLLHGHDRWPVQYTGQTEAQCIRKARSDGWVIGKERHLCPICTGKNVTFFERR